VTPARRGRSLFWTIAGLFLLTVALGTLLQALVADEVLRPLEARDARARAEIVASGLAADLAAAPAAATGEDLDSLLARRRPELGAHPGWILYRAADGTILGAAPARARFFEHPPAEGPAPGPPPERPRAHGPPGRTEMLARRAVVRGSTLLGEVQIMRPARPPGGPGFLATRTAILFLPIAMLASVVAGLIILRLLVRRLRALETLAARVTEGDLSVRIADTSGDEIGRLAERLDRMTERLAEARAQLEATERQRRQLFADITHELATPLTSIRGYAETMLDAHVQVSQQERTGYLRSVLEESRRLDRLIRDLFELARLEAGAAPLEKERLDWVALSRNTIGRFEPRFRDAGLALLWRGSLPQAWIEADGRRMEEVLENLLTNALRYVPAGGTVELSIERVGGIANRFRLTASDDGPGVPAEELSLVFERFYRGAGVRSSSGSGLGLAIVREIVHRHGGEVRAGRREPQGTTFVVEIPALPA
jgi:signal transduction histidine kinase